MTIICTTICIVVTIICATFCFIFVEKYHTNANLSEDKLLENIYIIAINEINRSQNDIQSYMINEDDGTTLYNAAKNCLSVLTTIVTLTRNYSK